MRAAFSESISPSGRHNALDKLLGALVNRRIDFSSGAVLVTSRAS
jgi:FdhD protein